MIFKVKVLAVLFDLDGTLVRLPIDYAALREDLKKIAIKYGMDSEFRPIIGEVARLSKLVENGEEFVESCIRIICDYEEEAAKIAKPITGAKEALSLIKSTGKKIGVVSNNSSLCVIEALKNVGLSGYVDVVVGREGLKVKPEPYPILLAINKLGMNNENVVMIGDSESDVKAAEGAGIRQHIFKGGDLSEFVRSIEYL